MHCSGAERRRLLIAATVAAAVTALGVVSYLYVVRPILLTEQRGVELRAAVEHFHALESAIQTRLNPELLLSVATRDYYSSYVKWNETTVFCQSCDRFWVVTAAEVREIRVLDYSDRRAVVRARVWTQGHMVRRDTLARFDWIEHPATQQATYEFLRQSKNEPWKVQAMHDFCAAPCE